MTVEDRLQLIIGRQVFTIAALETELEKLRAELEEVKKPKPEPAE